MNVLVLGWEYPPAVAGGLGAACHGLTNALASSAGVRVTLAVPATCGAGELAVGEPGIERVEIPTDGGRSAGSATSWDGMPHALSPYAVPKPVYSERDATAPVDRAGAAETLYGSDFGRSLAAYTRGVLDAFGERRGAFDVIHAHDWMTIPAAMRLRVALGIPVCLHVHSTVFDRSGLAAAEGPLALPAHDPIAVIEAAGVRAADRVIAVSEFTRDVIQRGFGVAAERIGVVHNAVACDSAASAAIGALPETPAAHGGPTLRANAQSSPRRKTVLFVGRLVRQKGGSFFLRAAARVLAYLPNVRFVVVGDGDERARLVEEVAALGLARHVVFTGSVDDATRDRLYASADLYVMTSLAEPFGLTPLEALQRGTAVILPRAAGVAEVLRSAPAIDPWDLEALSDEIVRLLGDDAARAELVRASRAEAAALSWDASGARLAAILGEASAA